MKATVLSFSTLLILATNLLVASAASIKVLDIDGQEVRPGINYYILPVVRGNGGGLKLYSGRTSRCPMDVVQEPNELNRGIPVKFTPASPREPIVRASADLNIRFSGASICGQSTVWRLDGGRGAGSGQLFVSTGGVLGNPGGSTITSDQNKVIDIDGQELRTGTNYYILPVEQNNVGGGLYDGRSDQCPRDVVQEFNPDERGIPVTFTPAYSKEPTIRESEDLNIKFSGESCAPLNVWTLDGGQRFVSTGGVLGSPGRATISNWFRIEKIEGGNNSYK
ncbi:hypothetical protein AgCh_008244 [Apium graveolens]